MPEILGLHGSSGDPSFIRNFVERLAPAMPARCPQGGFADSEGFTFFRRNPDFSIPAETLLELARASVSADGWASQIGSSKMIAVGYSSGAIFATALLAVAPNLFAGSILLRPQAIAEDFAFPDLSGKPVLIISGRHDARRRPHHAALLAEQLSQAGARVTHHALDAGHGWASDDMDLHLSTDWMAEYFGR